MLKRAIKSPAIAMGAYKLLLNDIVKYKAV